MSLRSGFERFCYKNRDKGIPNLMLIIALGIALVCLLSLFNGGTFLFDLFYFNKYKILEGQVWRLFTFVFTQAYGDVYELLFLYFFYLIGRRVELTMGTFKFNLYYLTGVVLMDIFAMVFCPLLPVTEISDAEMTMLSTVLPYYWGMALYLHLSLLLTFATMHPDTEFLLMFIIPIKGWVIALVYLLLEFIAVFNLSIPNQYFPHNLFPLIGLGNYLLFMGKDVFNLIPLSWRRKKKATRKTAAGSPIPFRQDHSAPKKPDYSHRCTICGRTDVTNPELEFRYCSRCNGYYCYCQDHINNHAHIE